MQRRVQGSKRSEELLRGPYSSAARGAGGSGDRQKGLETLGSPSGPEAQWQGGVGWRLGPHPPDCENQARQVPFLKAGLALETSLQRHYF